MLSHLGYVPNAGFEKVDVNKKEEQMGKRGKLYPTFAGHSMSHHYCRTTGSIIVPPRSAIACSLIMVAR